MNEPIIIRVPDSEDRAYDMLFIAPQGIGPAEAVEVAEEVVGVVRGTIEPSDDGEYGDDDHRALRIGIVAALRSLGFHYPLVATSGCGISFP